MNWGGGTWCAHPRLQTDEAFSSWLHRGALANGVSDHTYCRHVLGERPSWDRDVDRYADVAMLASAMLATGEPLVRLQKSIMLNAQGRLFATHTTRGLLPWILPLGVRGRRRAAFGQQFCPRCLAEPNAYFRLSWRFAWMTVCRRHGILLQDACSGCASPVSIHRLFPLLARGWVCPVCQRPLADLGQHAKSAAMRFQSRLESAWRVGSTPWLGGKVSALALFGGLRSLCRGLWTPAHSEGLVDLMPLPMRRKRPRRSTQGIEYWRLPVRMFAMDALRRTLEDWPHGFVAAAREHRIYRSHFDDRRSSAQPDWLEMALATLERPHPNLSRR